MNKSLKYNDDAIDGRVELPSSKSISNRALIISALCSDTIDIQNLSQANDTGRLVELLFQDHSEYNAGDAGTVMRFFTAFLARLGKSCTLTGTERMKQRPIGSLVTALNSLGANIEYGEEKGFPPLRFYESEIHGGSITIDATKSSQFVSAIMMIASTLKDGLKIRFDGHIISRPYFDMTLKMMRFFGVHCEWWDGELYIPETPYIAKDLTIESDWSAASYIYSVLALSETGTVQIDGLKANSWQGDQKVELWMEQFGVRTEFYKRDVRLVKEFMDPPLYFEDDFSNHPDLVMTFAALCAGLGTSATFYGISHLRIKESDRVQALEIELQNLGVQTSSTENTLRLEGKAIWKPGTVIQTYNDHRMAMAFAPLAIPFGQIEIENPEVVVKSFPGFWDEIEKLGLKNS